MNWKLRLFASIVALGAVSAGAHADGGKSERGKEIVRRGGESSYRQEPVSSDQDRHERRDRDGASSDSRKNSVYEEMRSKGILTTIGHDRGREDEYRSGEHRGRDDDHGRGDGHGRDDDHGRGDGHGRDDDHDPKPTSP